MLRETTVEVTLTRPITVRDQEITSVRLHADEPGGLLAAVRERLEVASGR